jgi:hypothetical protein
LSARIFTIADDVVNLNDQEIISFLQVNLKKNRVVSLILSELNESGSITRSRLAELLQELFPSIQAVEKTWDYYSKTTAQWLHFARLAFYKKGENRLFKVDDESVFEAAFYKGRTLMTGHRFPLCFRNSIRECLDKIDSLGGEVTVNQLMSEFELSYISIEKVLADCLNLEFIELNEEMKIYSLSDIGLEFARSDEDKRRKIFKHQCLNVPVFNRFIYFVEEAGGKGIYSKTVAKALVREMQLDLAELTIEKLGAMLANWAEYAEIISRKGRLCFSREQLPEQLILMPRGAA